MSIDPDLGKAALRMSLFIIVGAVGMLPFMARGSPQFAITVITLLIGLIFFVAVVGLVRWFSR